MRELRGERGVMVVGGMFKEGFMEEVAHVPSREGRERRMGRRKGGGRTTFRKGKDSFGAREPG